MNKYLVQDAELCSFYSKGRWNSNKKLADRLDMTTATRVMAESGKRCLLLKA